MFLAMFLLGFILYGTLCLLDLSDNFLSHVKKVFNYNLFKYLLWSFFFFWDSHNLNAGAFHIVPEVFKTFFISFLSFLCSTAVIPLPHSPPHIPCSSSLILFFFFGLVILLSVSSRVFFISCIVFFISVCSLVLLGLH